MPDSDFEWPCDRREAHGPHPMSVPPEKVYRRTRWSAIWRGSLPALNFVESKTKPELNQLAVKHFQVEITPGATYDADALFNAVHSRPVASCSGVKAHPDTMIGR